MSLIVFADVVLPNSVIAAGVRGKNLRLNARVPTDGGFESINVIWSKTLRQYELGTVPLTLAQWNAIEVIHEITEGGAYGFLIEDPKDNAATVANGVFEFIPPGEHAEYQLTKRYLHAASTRYKDRAITRPQPGIVITQNGEPLAPGTYTVNPLTGRVIIDGDPPVESLAWSGRFYVPVHFLDDSIDWGLLVAGAPDSRFLSGPSIVLQEVRE